VKTSRRSLGSIRHPGLVEAPVTVARFAAGTAGLPAHSTGNHYFERVIVKGPDIERASRIRDESFGEPNDGETLTDAPVSRRGAHLRVRCAVLDQRLENLFRERYPIFTILAPAVVAAPT
jgi:hypothetical protein